MKKYRQQWELVACVHGETVSVSVNWICSSVFADLIE